MVSSHGLAESGFALAAPLDLGGHEFHVGHRGLGAVRRTTELNLFELGVVLAFLHLVVGLRDTPEL
jgi:hypothetical protein